MIYTTIKHINEFMWGNFLIILLLGSGLFFTIKFRFIQIRKFKEGFKRVTSSATLNGEKAGNNGMSSFQALATAIAAQVGTGNLAGAATAIASGGPGAIFWMWLSAFFGMSTIYIEATLAQLFKTRINNQVTGGPAYYISQGLGNNKFSKLLAAFFSISCIFALGFMGNAVQSNSIVYAFKDIISIPSYIIGLFLAILAGFVFFGGIKRLVSLIEKIVPTMAFSYIFVCLIILLFNINYIIPAFKDIIVGAFNPQAILGGALGITIKKSLRYGVSRGLFSNEAGMGSTPHAHAIAKVAHPQDQGTVALITVFIDTFVILTLTALVIIISHVDYSTHTGILLTQKAFETTLGHFGKIFIGICLFFFAFSTIIGWYFFGEANIKYLFKNKYSLSIYKILVMILIFLGSTLNVEFAWELVDLFNGFMVIPNIIALLFLYPMVEKASNIPHIPLEPICPLE